MAIAVILIIAVSLFFLLSVRGRTSHKDLPKLKNWCYAHRGLHSVGVPENSLAAFAAAKQAGYGIELDVHLLKDGSLAVAHDHSLKRCAGVDVEIEDLTAQELAQFPLEGTGETIPLLSQVLELVDGKVPLIVELKSTVKNYEALCEATCELLTAYKGLYCMESFDPRCVFWLRRKRRHIIRGQLVDNLFETDSKLPWVLKFLLRHQILNLFSKPDFIAYDFEDRKTISNFLCRKVWRMQGFTWTIRTQEDFDIALKEGWIPIFENFEP